MKKLPIITAAMMLAFVAKGAMAACSGPAVQVTEEALDTLLNNSTVCASRGGESWQEEHHAGGVLTDYKMGPNDTVDPTKQLGNWVMANTDTVTYTYTNGSVYSFQVWDNGDGTHSFCGQDVLEVTVQTGVGTGCN